MLQNPSPPTNQPLMLCLALLPRPVRSLSLSQLLRVQEHSIQEALHELRMQKLVQYHTNSSKWSAASESARVELGNRAARIVLHKEPEGQAEWLAMLWSNRLLDGAELAFRELEYLVSLAHTPGALVCLDILLKALTEWDAATHQVAENEQYIAVTTKVWGAVLYMGKRRRQANVLLDTLTKTAETLGNRRTVLKVKTMQLCLHYLLGGVIEEDPNAVLESLINEINELGDEDIISGTVNTVAIQNYIKGDFARTLEIYRLSSGRFDGDEYYSGVAVHISSICACNLGRFGHAIGTILASLRRCTEMGAQYAIKRTLIHGAGILLRAGMPDEALEMMNEAWTNCDAASESKLAVLALRNLAFYHFQKRHMSFSHAMMMESARVADRYRIMTPFRWFHDFLEIAWKYDELGLEPIPGYEIDVLPDRLLASPCTLTQGIALRMKGRELIKKQKYSPATPLLEASLAKLVLCGNPMEQARTKIDMAKCLAGQGQKIEARSLHAEACSTLERYHQYDRHWYGSDTHALSRPQSEKEGIQCARTWREDILDSSEWTSFESQMQRLVDTLRDALQVERTALYALEKDHLLDNLAARDFTAKEYTGKLTFTHGQRLLGSMQSGKTKRWRSRYGACLALPLKITSDRNCVFFAHCRYLVDSIMSRDIGYFEPVRAMLEEEVRLAYRIRESIADLRNRDSTIYRLAAERNEQEGAIYYGPAMHEVLEQADKAASTAAPVLVLGETGAGKEELSRRVHRKSGRTGPFVVINPASIPEQLFESELFGHEKGAFTGAYTQKMGVIELADKGTLFIDEIGELPQALQVKLLRVLQDQKYMRLGGTTLLHSDFRLISATNQDLQKKIQDGTFREDLYYRISVVPLRIPALRERPEDVKHLATMFHNHFATLYKIPVPLLSGAELEYLCSRAWPGNVRELRSLIERGVILHDPSKDYFLQESWSAQGANAAYGKPSSQNVEESAFVCDERLSMEEMQRRYIEHALKLTRGKVGGEDGANAILHMPLSTLYKLIKKFGLDKTTMLYGYKM